MSAAENWTVVGREIWPEELHAALAAVDALTIAQAGLPDGYWFDGKLTLRTDGMTLGYIVPNDVDSFNYQPVEEHS